MHIMPKGHIETDSTTSSYFVTLSLEFPKAQCLIRFYLSGKVSNWHFRLKVQAVSRSIVGSLIGLFVFRSNPVSKVYQHRSRNGGYPK